MRGASGHDYDNHGAIMTTIYYPVCCIVNTLFVRAAFLNRLCCLSMALSISLAVTNVQAAETDVLTKGSSNERGGDIYRANCVLCHGEKGVGDGRMAKVITEPPPANLIKSKRSKAYMQKIITYGGGIMGRSPQMPVWGQELDEQQIKDVVEYIYRLRVQ